MKTRRKKFVAAVDFSIDCRNYTAGDPYPEDRHLARLIRFGHVVEQSKIDQPKTSTPTPTTEEASDGTE